MFGTFDFHQSEEPSATQRQRQQRKRGTDAAAKKPTNLVQAPAEEKGQKILTVVLQKIVAVKPMLE